MSLYGRIVFIALLALMTASAHACLWDYDTLRDERRGLPGVAEILAGRWEKHSQFFYEDRVRRMNELLVRQPGNLDAWDNLAVAYQKLGQTDKAIETILAKDKLKPGQYTTHANLGTFLLFAGRLDEAIKEIELAIKINPDAHFGREKYQLRLAKYLVALQDKDGTHPKTFLSVQYPPQPVPMPSSGATAADLQAYRKKQNEQRPAMDKWAAEAQRVRDEWVADREHAIEGIVGMIRFGTDQSPDLYAALGELLADRRDAHLAWRAYQRAIDLNFRDPAWANEQRNAVARMTEDKSEFSGDVIAHERADADAWVKAYQQFEDDLIRAGRDPSDESLLAPFYAKNGSARESLAAPAVAERVKKIQRSPVAMVIVFFGIAIGIAVVLPIVTRFAIRRLRLATSKAAGPIA